MKLLAKLEQGLENLLEGLFRRGFQGELQPVEIGRRLVRALEENKRISISRTYVPNMYKVYLHPRDQANLASFSTSLRQELIGYLQQAVKREGYYFVREPEIEFIAAEDLQPGTMTIDASFQEGDGQDTGPLAEEPLFEDTNVFLRDQGKLVIVGGPELGREFPLLKEEVIIGRADDNDVVLTDRNISRRHLRIRKTPEGYELTDLDSLNGTFVGEERISRQTLESGERFRIGTTLIELR